MLDFDEREGVRGSEENLFRLVNPLNALGAREDPGFSSSSEPPWPPWRMLFGGSDGRWEMLDEEETEDGDRETDKTGRPPA